PQPKLRSRTTQSDSVSRRLARHVERSAPLTRHES
ncbi:unnamed protein product, partial [Brassica napus]